MKRIKLPSEKEVLVSDKDYSYLRKFSWKESFQGYAVRGSGNNKILMHRMILIGKYIDHKNGNKLDNRRCNLRVCTMSQNIANIHTIPKGTSKYKGVSWDKRKENWKSYIRKNYKYIHLGNFKYEKHAAQAYDVAAKKLFGSFASLNFS